MIYLAARYSRKMEIADFAQLIRKAGFTVVSTWHDQETPQVPEDLFTDDNKDMWKGLAIQDLNELEQATTLIFFSESPNVGVPRGGRHVEFGYFLNKTLNGNPDLTIYIIGPVENLFNSLADEVFADKATFIYEMAKRIDLP